jgi:hypothetical protein
MGYYPESRTVIGVILPDLPETPEAADPLEALAEADQAVRHAAVVADPELAAPLRGLRVQLGLEPTPPIRYPDTDPADVETLKEKLEAARSSLKAYAPGAKVDKAPLRKLLRAINPVLGMESSFGLSVRKTLPDPDQEALEQYQRDHVQNGETPGPALCEEDDWPLDSIADRFNHAQPNTYRASDGTTLTFETVDEGEGYDSRSWTSTLFGGYAGFDLSGLDPVSRARLIGLRDELAAAIVARLTALGRPTALSEVAVIEYSVIV